MADSFSFEDALSTGTNQGQTSFTFEDAAAASSGPRSAIGEVGTGIKRGVIGELPKVVGQAMQWAGEEEGEGFRRTMHDVGEGIAESAEERLKNPNIQLQPDQHNAVTNALAAGGEMLAPSIAPAAVAGLGLAAIPGVAATSGLGLAAASLAGAVPLGMSQAQDTYERVQEAGGDKAAARAAGWKTGAIETLGETAGTYLGGKLLGVGGKVLKKGAQKTMGSTIGAATDTAVIKPFGKQLVQTALGEVATEMGQGSSQAYVEREAGVNTDPWTVAKESIAPTLGMTALLAPFGLAGFYNNSRRADAIDQTLTDPAAATPEERLQVVDMLHRDAKKQGVPDADEWRTQATLDVAQGLPVRRTVGEARPQANIPPNSPLTRAASLLAGNTVDPILATGYATTPADRIVDRRADPEGWARQEEAAKTRNEQALNRGDVVQRRAKGGAAFTRDIPQADQNLTRQGKDKVERERREAARREELARAEAEYQRYIDPGLTEQEERQSFPATAGMETEDRRREGEWTKQSKAAEDYNRRRNVRGEVDRTAREYDEQLGADFERALIDGGTTLPLSKAEEQAGRSGFPGTTGPMTAKQPESKPNPRQREMDEFELAYNPDARASLMGTAMATDDKGRSEWLRQEKKALTQNKVRNFQDAQTSAQAVNEQKRREQAEAEEARKRATDPLYDAKQRFQESYDAAGTIPQVDYPSDQAAKEFEQKVKGQQKDRQHREWVRAYRRKQAEDKALAEDETIPPEVRKQAAKEAEDIVNADPVYGHMAEAKRRGKINLEAFGQDYDKDTIRQIIRRYPGIFSQVGTVKPDDFASEMGYASLDDMVRRFSEARTKTELTAQIIRESTGEWQQAEDAKQADDEFFAAKAERSDGGARWKGEPGGYQGRPLRTRFPAPEEEIGYMEDMIRRHPDRFTDDDLDHWTYTAEQQGRLRQALREAQQDDSSGSEMSDNTEQGQGQGDTVASNATPPADAAAADAAHSPDNDLPDPTDAQKEAGNYKKAHVRLYGLDISIENPAGSTRSGVDPDGKRWEVSIRDHYGYIKGTVGKDKDHLDVFIPEGFIPTDKDKIFVVNQIDPKTGKFDEHKIVFGSQGEAAARTTYLRNYDKTGPSRIGSITEMPLDEFKGWLDSGDTTKATSPVRGSDSAKDETQPSSPGADETQADLPGAGTATAPSPGEASKGAREPWQMTRAEFLADPKTKQDANHYNAVASAASAGRPVPAAVLADYPDLAKKYGQVSNAKPQQSADMADVPETDFGETNAELPQDVEAELAATSDEDLDAMMDDVFGEEKPAAKQPKAPARPRMTPLEKFLSDMENNGAARDARGRGFKIVSSPADDGSFVLEVVDESGDRRTIGRPYPPGRGFSRAEAIGRAVEEASFEKPARQAQPKPPKTAGQITKQGGIEALEGVKSAMAGLNALFGSKNRLGSGLAFDEDTYAQAKPHFVQAWNHAKEAGYSLKELLQYFHDQFGKAVRPYLERFLKDVKAGDLTVPEADSTVNQGYAGRQTGGADNERADNARPDQPGTDVTIRKDDGAVEGDGDSTLGQLPPEVRQGAGETESAAGGGDQGGGKGTGGDQGTDGGRVPTPRGGRGRAPKVHSAQGGAGNNERDGESRPLTAAPATIPAQNFVITPDLHLGKGGEVAKFNDNVAAITTLKAILSEQRRATPDEQAVLAKYVGWGGLANAFKNSITGEIKPGWEKRVGQIEELLSPAELATARNSTQNAHYTSEAVVSAMWHGLQRLGFSGGIVLEPSVGTGNFLGLVPRDVAGKTRFVAAEFDHITAGIAKLLYPKEAVFHTPFEKLPLPSNEFDAVIGNPPFGKTRLSFSHLPTINQYTIHNQFFLAGLDALKPGCVQAFVVSRYLMDAKDSTVREQIAKKAELLGAIRLPDVAFKENARTEVITDIIFLRKKQAAGRQVDQDANADETPQVANNASLPTWVNTVDIEGEAGQEPITVNAYFANNPEMILGKLGRTGSMRRDNDVGVQYDGSDLGGDLVKIIDKALPEKIIPPVDQESSAKAFESMATSLHLSLTGEEDGSVSIDDNGDLIHIYEKLSPSGAYLLARRVLTPESPWSNKLTLNHDGRWSEEVDLLGDDGKPVKRIINGKKTNRNEKTLKYYTEAEVPSTMRLGNDPYNRLRDAVGLLGMVKGQINLESSETASNDEIEAHRKKLDRAYDAFVSKHDHVNSGTVSKTVADVPNGALLLALEKAYTRPITKAKAKTLGIDPRPGSAEKADILSRRVIFPYSTPNRAEGVDDALALNLSETGRVDLEMISSLLGKTEQEVIADLHDNLDEPLIFFDPELQSWEKADEYLGGNVVKKLNAARGAGLEKNVEALEKIQPKPWGADKVTILPGATWVPESVYTDFVSFLTDAPARVRFQKATNTFFVEADTITEKAKKWGTEARDVSSLVSAMLNSKTIRVTYYDRANETTVFDQEATEAAAMKIAEIKEEFSSWVFKDGDRRRLLVDLFNQKYNVRVLKQRNGQHLKLPGKVPDTLIRMRRHQMNAIWRGVVDRFVLYDHAVGAGKTFTGIARAMERRRMGLSKKPMIVVPNHLVEQFAADVYRLYPGAKVLAAGKKDLEKRKRRRLFAKIATGDWDVVIVPHSSFAFIGIHPDTELRYVEEELRVAEEAVREAEEEAASEGYNGPGKPLTVKQAEALRDRLRARMESVRKGANNRDRLLTFEQMGVDDLTVDEAHEFKNLFYSSNMQARGMNPRAGSAKAYDLWTKIRTLRETNGSVAFMTGTPISNSAVEMYTMMRYLAADDLADMGMEHFDSWRAQFVDATTEFEPTESGRGLKEVNRLGRDWSNMRALMDLYYSFSDSVSNEDIQQWYREDNPGREFPIPKVKDGGRVGVNVKPTAAQEQLIQEIVSGFEGLQDIKPISLRNATRLRLMDAAKKVSLDARVLVPGLQSDEKGGKLDIASQRIADIYRKWTADKGTQLVFLDRSVPKQRGDKKRLDEYDKRLADLREAEQNGDEAGERKALEALEKYDHNEMETIRAAQAGGWNAYQQIKDNLIAAGIPEKEIRFVQDANTDEQKQELFDEVNSGSVRVLIGSTPRMGAGTNVQQRLVALHHVDVTWKPSDIEQREGRIIRQGNLFSTPPTESRPNPFFKPGFEVEILAYTTETTVDAKLWSLNSTKLRMINGIRQYNGEFNMEFDDEDSVGMAEIAAIASGNPLQLERVKLDAEIKKLERQQSAFNRQQWGARDRVESLERTITKAPAKISFYGKFADKVTAAQEGAKKYLKGISVNVNGKTFTRDGSSHQDALDLVDDLAKQASEEKEKGFLVEIDGEKYRSADKAKAAIRAKMGDGLEFVFDFDGNRFISSDEARRHIADMANKAMEGKPDEIDDVILGDVSYQGLEFELSFSTEMDKDKEGRPLKLVGFHFDQKGVDPEDMAERITATASGTVLRINNKINLNSLNLLFRNIRDKVKVVPGEADYWRDMMEDAKKSLPAAREMADQEFPKAEELDQKRQRLGDVEKELSASADKKGGGQQPTDDYIEQTRQGTATGEENITYAVSESRGDAGQAAGVVRDRAGSGVRAGGQLDLFAGEAVPTLHQRRAKRSVFAQVKHATSGTFTFSGGPVGSMAEIAGIAKPIMDDAQESNLLVMLDEKNMPVAVLKHSVGGKASGPIDPGVVLGVAHSIKAVKTIWSVHNHPSGTAMLSGSDRTVATLLAEATRGTGINFAGMVAVTLGGRFTGTSYRDGAVDGGDFFGDATADKGAKVSGLTRKVKKLSDQRAVTNDNDISLWMMDNAPGQSGVLLLDNRNRPAAFVPMATATMAKLRTGEKGTGASELLAAAEQVNATALVPISTDTGKAGEDAARNIAVFAQAHAFTVLDALVDGQSARDLVRETVDDHKWRGGAKSAASAFFSKAEAVPVGDRADIPGELAQAFGKLRARVLMRKITVLESQEDAKAMVRRLGGKLSAAWHGSPHDFDEFRMSAIGTGEGAQAYGHGLYFASAKGVAEHYKKKLSEGAPVLYKGKDIGESFRGYGQNHVDALMEIASSIKNGLSPSEAISEARERWSYWEGVYREAYDNAYFAEMKESAKEYADMSSEMGRLVAALKPKDFEQKPGRLYKVELAPQEDEYLLWDRPLSEQSEKVRAALADMPALAARRKVVESRPQIYTRPVDEVMDMAGSDLYELVSESFVTAKDETGTKGWAAVNPVSNDRAASEYLHSIGIRGIKYLDQDSRDGGQGTHNYVIFDESDVTITAKYSKDGAIQGIYANGKTYLVADGIARNQAVPVLLHELGEHAAQLGFAGDREYQGILRSLEKRAEAQNATGEAIRAAMARVPADTAQEHYWSEVAAYLVENKANSEIGIVKRILNFFKRWLYKAGAINADRLTPEDLVLFARAATLAHTGATYGEGVRQSVASASPLSWDAPLDSKKDSFLYNAQNKLIDLFRVQDAIQKHGGTIDETNDVRLAEELYHKRSSKRVDDFLINEVKPLMAELAAISKDEKEFERFLWARHAGEANESLRLRNPTADELREMKREALQRRNALAELDTVKAFLAKEREIAAARHDVETGEADDSLLMVLNQEMNEVKADPIVQEYERARARHEGLKKVQPFEGDNTWLSGMKTDKADEFLRSLPADRRAVYADIARKWDTLIQRTRETLVEYELEDQETIDSWANAFQHYVPLNREDMDGGKGIGQGFSVKGSSTKGRVGSHRAVSNILANIVLQRERAIVRGEKAAISRALHGLATANPNKDFWSIEIPPTERTVDPVTGMVINKADMGYKNKPNVVVNRFINERGKIEERAVVFEANNKRAVRMAEALKNLDTQDLGAILGASAKITRFFSAMNTQYNVVFGPVNLVRDAQAAVLNLSTTPLKDKKAAVVRRIAGIIPSLYKAVRAENTGRPLQTEIAKAWREMQLEGGTTGFRDMFADSNERAERLRADILQIKKGKALQSLYAMRQWVSDYNDMLENSTRLAVYMEARAGGISKKRAAQLAKDVTLNFNRKGQVATQAGAMYAFFNAAAQGTEKMYRTLTGPAGKKILTGGLLVGAAQTMLLAAAGFDDDEPPEFIRERNLIIPIGDKKYLTVPMPLGFHVIPNLTRVPTEWALRGFKEPGKTATEMIAIFAEAFNPLGNAGFSLQSLAPTPMDPFIALGENKDWTGRPIAKQDFNSLKPTPGHTRARDTASWPSEIVSRGLNLLTGGNEYVPGMLSPTPDQIDYLVGQVTGGVGRETGKLLNTGRALARGEDAPAYRIPFVGRFYGNSNDVSGVASRYYDNLKRFNRLDLEMDGIREDGGDVRAFIAANPAVRGIRLSETTYRQLQKLQRAKRHLLERDAPRERIVEMDRRITDLMRNFNNRAASI